MQRQSRKHLLIDRNVQGALIRRVILHWFLSVNGTFCLLVLFPLVLGFFVPGFLMPTAEQILLQTWRMFWPCLFASALMLPLLIVDVIRLSHRFVGPMFRLRSGLKELAEGKPVRPMKFREGDFWFEVADEFNRATAQVSGNSSHSPASASSEQQAD